MDILMGVLDRLIRRYYEYLAPYPNPAFKTMRRGPDIPQLEGLPGPNPLMIQFFTWDCSHPTMSWWKHFETEVPTLAELGVTQVWLPPPNKAMVPKGQGYDAYDLWDLGEFYQKKTIATRWGTKEELIAAAATARAHGIDILIDAILNHKIGADRTERFMAVPVDPNHRLRDIGLAQEIEGWTAFDFPGRRGKYSALKWTKDHFTGLDWDHSSKTKGVFRIVGEGHHGWSDWVDKELGNYDYLLGIDIDHRHPEVQKDLLAWGAWILETTGAMGFRLDAIKHMDRRFLLEFIKNARKLHGRENLFAVAEYWSANVNLIKPYIRTFEGLLSFFDVPLHHNFHNASKAGSHYDLRTILDNTVINFRPGDAVTFVDNHDTQIGQTLESWVGSNFKLQAYALILLRQEGYPCLFYGDLYPNEECYDEKIATSLKPIVQARKKFAYGAQKDYFQERNCIGFVREGGKDGGCAVLISNADAVEGETSLHTIRMNIGTNHAGKYFTSYLDGSGGIEIAGDGWASFTCPKGGLQVWVQQD